MGGWVLEVFKMSLYISFPVALFHYFNSPGNIENQLMDLRMKLIGDPDIEQKEKDFKKALDEIALAKFNK